MVTFGTLRSSISGRWKRCSEGYNPLYLTLQLQVLDEKYKYDAKEAAEIASFLGQMLKFNPLQRASAQECLRHSWLTDTEKGKT